MSSEAASEYRVPVAGIGASAGGVRALQAFFAALPTKIGIALVVVVHLDPEHASELASILATQTKMRVMQVVERTPLEVDTVYVIPPNRRLLITGSDIATAPFDEPRGQRAPIDLFFRSLAEQHGDGFAIILSGSGSDGAVGVRAVREKGGLILVQDPAEAEYASMPRSAISSGADFVLPVKQLAAQLVELIQAKDHVPQQELNDKDEDVFRRILGQLRGKTGQDFSKYKRATVMRRLARRMQIAQTESLESYSNYLREHPEEVQALFNDLLISVTSFFRDPSAYKVLAEDVVPNLFTNQSDDHSVRVWVPGCATGEEAYSIAMLLLEEAGRREARPEIQVFASDLDAGALAAAREGRYPTAIAADVSEERLRRFFTREGEHYRIRREVRDLVVFASHSLLKDPPFSRLNLISCRNLLIYLDRDLQHQVISIFHYALLPGAYLFLGTSETAEAPPGLFTTVDRDARLYQATERARDRLPPLPRVLTAVRIPEFPSTARPQRSAQIDAVLHRHALETSAPPSMLVDEGHLIANLSESAGRFLQHPGGPLTNDAADVVRPELRLELRAALHRAFESNERTVSLPIPVQFNGSARAVVLFVQPIHRAEGTSSAIVMFIEGGAAELNLPGDGNGSGDASATVIQLREELHATRTLLRTSREQYESATEELRAANEELQSINEEYRSTAEELETSKEELQSINEELQTLNNELKLKLDMVSRAHNDLQNLMSATDVGTLFLDRSLRIKRFTPHVTALFNIAAGDEGRPVTDFTHRLEYGEMVEDARSVLADLIPIEQTIRTNDDCWFLMRIRPYRTLEDKIEGVVVTFVDVTERRRADAAWVAQQNVLLGELSHRVKNTLAVVQAVARYSFRGTEAKAAMASFEARLQALSSAHDLLVHNEWKGANVASLARQQLAPYLEAGSERVRITGQSIVIPAAFATPLALVIHELATNAAKYGALKDPRGYVELNWELSNSETQPSSLEFTWNEHCVAPIAAPAAPGAGMTLINNSMSGANVHHEFRPEGLKVTMSIPLRRAGDPS